MRSLFLAVAFATAAVPALAETTISTGGTLEFRQRPGGAGSANDLDVSAYGEVEISGLYAGVSALKSNDSVLDEMSFSLGYRGEIGRSGYDIGLGRYVYRNDPLANYTEVVLDLSRDVTDRLSANLDLGYDITNRAGNASLGAAFAAFDRLAVSASLGVYEVPGLSRESEWDFGATYAINDKIGADLRWYDGTDYVAGYVGLMLTWDTSLIR